MNRQSSNYTGVLLEEINPKLDAVIEIAQSLRDTKADKSDISRLEEAIKNTKQISDGTVKRFNTLHEKHTKQINILQKKISG